MRGKRDEVDTRGAYRFEKLRRSAFDVLEEPYRKVVDGKDQTRTVALWVRHADPNLLVLEAAKGTAGGVGSDDVGSGEVLVFERTLELADELKKLRVVADDAPTLSMPKMPKLPDGIPSLPKLPSLPDSFKGPFN